MLSSRENELSMEMNCNEKIVFVPFQGRAAGIV